MVPASALARTVTTVLLAAAFAHANAQLLVVNDNDNITYNTDTLLHDLTAAGFAYDVYDIPTAGAPPTSALMDGYDQVIWYCSTDGLDLGFWNATAQIDIIDRILAGKRMWIIGADVLFAQYGTAPITFTSGDFLFDFMGIASYDVQSYGDDDNTGCPGLVVTPEAEGSFAPALNWIFPTAWWVDGVTPTPDATAIYTMGPEPYVLDGAISMLHFDPPGSNVMSTLFDPALIGTFEARVDFLLESLGYAGYAGMPERAQSFGPRLSPNPVLDRVELRSVEIIHGVTVTNARGVVVLQLAPAPAGRSVMLDLATLPSGAYVATVTDPLGQRSSVVLVKE
jgi:hypothetical protein